LYSDLNAFEIELLAAWPVFVGLLTIRHSGRRSGPQFLCYAYVAGMAINHWFGAVVHVLPWNTFLSSENTFNGFEATTWGMACFTIGALLTPPPSSLTPEIRPTPAPAREVASRGSSHDAAVARSFFLTGVAAYVIARTPLGSLPSATSLVSGASQLLVAGICIGSWQQWQRGNRSGAFKWIALGFLLPIYTTLGQGFMGFGINALMTILIFFGTFFRPRWVLGIIAIVAVYAALSLAVAYFSHRGEIRAAVWAEQSVSTRVGAFLDMAASITPFDVTNPDHLLPIDGRLNQNELVGAAMHFVPEMRPFADGATIYFALIALVPRLVWLDKPGVGGGGNVVATYSGIPFAQGTSVGVGPVIEYYINFGWTGITIGFLIFGMVARAIDYRLAAAIKARDWSKVAVLFPTALALIQPLGSLVEITTSAAGAGVLGLAIGWLLKRGVLRGRQHARERNRFAGRPRNWVPPRRLPAQTLE
jgi:hypothetical protein